MLRFCEGSKHDFQLFKESNPHLDVNVWYVLDSGYQGLQKEHPLVCIPQKKSKNKPLSLEQKQENRSLSSFRVRIEHVIRSLKIWPILKEVYRNRRKPFSLRFTLIAAIYNFELDLP